MVNNPCSTDFLAKMLQEWLKYRPREFRIWFSALGIWIFSSPEARTIHIHFSFTFGYKHYPDYNPVLVSSDFKIRLHKMMVFYASILPSEGLLLYFRGAGTSPLIDLTNSLLTHTTTKHTNTKKNVLSQGGGTLTTFWMADQKTGHVGTH